MSNCTLYEAPLVNTSGGVLAFTTGISEQDFIDNFGLVSPNIQLDVMATVDEVVVSNTLDHHEGPIVFQIVLKDGFLSYRFPVVGEPLTVTILPSVELVYLVEVVYRDVSTNQELRYVISYLRDALRAASATVCIPPVAENTVRLPVIQPTVKPNFAGFIYLTDNLQYVSQIDLQVQLAFNGCCDGLTATDSSYTYYAFPLQCVMKGVGQSPKEKFDSIAARCPNYNLNYEHFLQYSVLRTAITAHSTLGSSNLNAAAADRRSCGRYAPFSVELLRRRYEPEFRALVTGTKYYAWFYESSVAKYWKLFDY